MFPSSLNICVCCWGFLEQPVPVGLHVTVKRQPELVFTRRDPPHLCYSGETAEFQTGACVIAYIVDNTVQCYVLHFTISSNHA